MYRRYIGERTNSVVNELSSLRGSERYEACEDDAGPVIVYGVTASVVYGLILCLIGKG